MPIVTAVGIAVHSEQGEDVAKRIEQAMADAVKECIAEGIELTGVGAKTVQDRMTAAREKVLSELG